MVVLGLMKKKDYGKMKRLMRNGKQENLQLITTRMQGWQLETFKESYEHKKNKGISLFKKEQLKKNRNYKSFFIESISLK